LIPLVICSLTISLATRFCVHISSQAHTSKSVERRSVEPKRQHLNKDAIRWVASATPSTFFRPATLDLRVAPAQTPLPSHIADESLYNRPPPSGLSLTFVV
jgi:hypothetical protein